jgi:hypothetical protein
MKEDIIEILSNISKGLCIIHSATASVIRERRPAGYTVRHEE